MKKNMFLVQSFVTLAAFSATQILGMSKEAPQIPQGFVERIDSQPLNKKNKKHRSKKVNLTQSADIKKETDAVPAAPADAITEVASTSAPETSAATPEIAPASESTPAEPTIEIASAPEAPATEPEATSSVETTTALEEAKAIVVRAKVLTEEVIGSNENAIAQMVKIVAEIQKVAAQIETKEAKATEITEQPVVTDLMDQLAASVYNPAPETKQGLGWTDWIKSSVSPQWFALDAVKAKTFDPENADHMKKLMDAAEKLVLSGDLNGLMDLVNACRANYPNVELKRKVASQIKKRFDIDEAAMVEEYKNSITAENKKLEAAQQAMLDKTTALLTTLQKQLEDNAAELSKAQVAYVTATNLIAEAQSKKIKTVRNSDQNLHKLRRDLSVSAAYPSEHLNAIKAIDAMNEKSIQALDCLNNVDDQIKTALSLLPSAEKTAILAADKK